MTSANSDVSFRSHLMLAGVLASALGIFGMRWCKHRSHYSAFSINVFAYYVSRRCCQDSCTTSWRKYNNSVRNCDLRFNFYFWDECIYFHASYLQATDWMSRHKRTDAYGAYGHDSMAYVATDYCWNNILLSY